MTYFLKSGNTYNIAADNAIDMREKLPADTYTVKFNERTGAYYLETISGFDIKGKLYGDTQSMATRILDTFKDRPNSTGVMLAGEKGSGKTLLAKTIAINALAEGIPTLVINQPWCGEVFNGFVQLIDQPAVIIFDEFEKTYDREEQEKLLTLLDGVYPSQKLFIITCNDRNRVNEHMKNRPGRIYYRLDFTGLAEDFIVEYCEDNLQNTQHIEGITRLAALFSEFNFDILKALVEEMNRYGEAPQDAMKLLNAKPELNDASEYTFVFSTKGKIIDESKLSSTRWRGNPYTNEIYISYLAKDDDDESDWMRSTFSVSDLFKVDPGATKLHFENSAGDAIALSRVVHTPPNWDAMM